MKLPASIKTKIFADGADKSGMLEMARHDWIKGFTTNPTLMRKVGVGDYETFAHEVLEVITDRPISFEVISDDFEEMEKQARRIANWAENVYVKIPVTNTRRNPATELIRRLSHDGIKVNVTAILTLEQIVTVSEALEGGSPAYVSLFAGRVADTGRDPVPIMKAAVESLRKYSNIELIWASPRELLNLFQASAIGCHILTATTDILKKLELIGKDLNELSLETVKMFYDDATKAGYHL
ncbi:transaldolase [bacterium]|nr:transaldolase [bacterium]